MPRKTAEWVVHATHPTTYQTHIFRLNNDKGWAVYEVLVGMGYLGVMISAADYYDGPKFEDPWANMRAKGEVVEVKA